MNPKSSTRQKALRDRRRDEGLKTMTRYVRPEHIPLIDAYIEKLKENNMKTTFVRILAGNMGDGWKSQHDAAGAYANWLEKNKGVETEVVDASGVSGGCFDDNGDETMDSDIWWSEWCGSEDALQYAE